MKKWLRNGEKMNLYNQLSDVESFFLIAGPCAIEEENLTLKIAEYLKYETERRNLPFVFKASYKKANRTSIHSSTGMGMQEGLKILEKVKVELGLPVLTDVHETCEVEAASEVVDILQIPAFLSRQTELLLKAGATQKIVNIKKGQFMAPENIMQAAEKITSCSNYKVLLTERGTTFGYHDLIVDFRSFFIMQQYQFPVIFDVTHSLQKPSIAGTSGGSPEFAPMMAKAALATGMVQGLFIETHPYPEEAISDASSMLPMHLIPFLLDECVRIKNAGGNHARF
jgi:2-dehydro-3-deoxyphosphooctonate aldolase (KDO 8-P synthase)